MNWKNLAALDIGGGTQDFFFWQDGQDIENAFKMVAPSPTRLVASRVRKATKAKRPIFLRGSLMGGGAMERAVRDHLEAGLDVWAQAGSAASIADNLEKVTALGVRITESAPQDAQPIETTDLDQKAIIQTLGRFETPPPEAWAVAVCDHGYSPGFSNRKFRFGMWRDFLGQGGRMLDLITDDPPTHMTRMRAVLGQAPGALIMDTAAAALWGALQDPAVAGQLGGGVCVVNLGNMHTVGFLAKGQRVLGVYEHHTSCLDPFTLNDQINRFIKGELSDQEVFDGRGHGVARLDDAFTSAPGPVVVTGPQRRLAHGLGWRIASPHGDVMLSGCFGLTAAALAREGGRLTPST